MIITNGIGSGTSPTPVKRKSGMQILNKLQELAERRSTQNLNSQIVQAQRSEVIELFESQKVHSKEGAASSSQILTEVKTKKNADNNTFKNIALENGNKSKLHLIDNDPGISFDNSHSLVMDNKLSNNIIKTGKEEKFNIANVDNGKNVVIEKKHKKKNSCFIFKCFG